MHFANEHFGRILLGAALVLAVVLNAVNPAPPANVFPEEMLSRKVQVKFDRSALVALSNEVYFAKELPPPLARSVFEEDKPIKVFTAVDLDIPPAGVKRPAQLLPEPGPSLDGSQTLPRFGDEFFKVVKATAADGKAATTASRSPARSGTTKAGEK